jgi:histidine triad (HIT) family protein
MASIFTKIINKEIPAFIIAEDDDFIAFLDIMPLAIGHTLVVPKKEVDYIFDCDDDVLSKMLVFSKKVSKKIESAIPCKRIGVAVIGLEVPHTHVHLVPLNHVGDINFERPKLSISKEELKAIADKINLG